jgi:hypothetical protein
MRMPYTPSFHHVHIASVLLGQMLRVAMDELAAHPLGVHDLDAYWEVLVARTAAEALQHHVVARRRADGEGTGRPSCEGSQVPETFSTRIPFPSPYVHRRGLVRGWGVGGACDWEGDRHQLYIYVPAPYSRPLSPSTPCISPPSPPPFLCVPRHLYCCTPRGGDHPRAPQAAPRSSMPRGSHSHVLAPGHPRSLRGLPSHQRQNTGTHTHPAPAHRPYRCHGQGTLSHTRERDDRARV